MKKLTLTTLFLMCLNFMIWAGDQEKHEFTLGGSLGMSTLKLTINSMLPTGGVYTGYNFFFNDVIGASTGLGWSFYKWQSSISPFTDRYQAYDGEELFEFRSSFSDYHETQTASYLHIPLAIRFQYPLFHDDHLTYFAIGGKACIPTQSNYKTSGATFTTSAYYPAYEIVLESPASRGLGTFRSDKQVAGLHLKTIWMIFAEAGMKWDIAPQFSLYGGICVDYSLKSIKPVRGKRLLAYDAENPANFTFNSMLTARYTEDNITRNFITRSNPLSVGVVIRIAYKLPE